MRYLTRIIVALLFFFCWQFPTAQAQDIAVLKSVDIKPYIEVLEGYRQSCDFDLTEYTLSELDSAIVLGNIRKGRPALVFAIGRDALELAKDIKGIPVVFTMVSNPEALLPKGNSNLAGVSMNVSARRQLSALLSVMPGLERIGMVYDPRNSRLLFEVAREAAAELHVTLVAREVHGSKKVMGAVNEVMGDIDAFWMIPDSTVVFPEAVEFLMLDSFEKNVPVLTFSERYVALGALLSLNIDAGDMGWQACEMSKSILGGKDITGVVSPPRKAILSINRKTSQKMGIILKESLVSDEYPKSN